MQHFLRNFCSRSNRFWVSWVKWSEWLTGRSCQGIDDASSANSTAPEGEKSATKAGFDRGSWVVSEKTTEDSSSPLSASICCSTFWWNVSTTSFSPRANMQTAAFSWRLILLWFCVKTNPFALQSLLGASRAIVILNFSSFSNAMQTCKWYIGSPLLMVLVLVHSRIFFGNWVFRAFLASCATAFDHALAKLNIDLGFKMKVSSTTRADTTVEVRGHRETRLETWLDCFTCDQVYIGIYFRYTLLKYISWQNPVGWKSHLVIYHIVWLCLPEGFVLFRFFSIRKFSLAIKAIVCSSCATPFDHVRIRERQFGLHRWGLRWAMCCLPHRQSQQLHIEDQNRLSDMTSPWRRDNIRDFSPEMKFFTLWFFHRCTILSPFDFHLKLNVYTAPTFSCEHSVMLLASWFFVIHAKDHAPWNKGAQLTVLSFYYYYYY